MLKTKPAILHIQWVKIPLLDFYYYNCIKFLFPKIKIIYTVHNILPHSPIKSDKKSYTKLYNLFDSLIVHTENSLVELNNMLGDYSNTPINVIPHGLLEYPIDESEVDAKIDFLNLNDLFKEKIVFSSLGIQNYYKGIDLLIDVWLDNSKIRNNNNIILLMGGKGKLPRIDELKGTANVFIDNNYLEDDVFLSYLKISDVVLLPYRKISQSGLLLTALNYEKPIIASSIGGLKDPFKHGDIGWLIDPNNIEELR
ncbi:MAG TPA: glycosyltransferase, partial [Epulopiscium sp.]|nr:glycosyltransferase [Candidatus Epulonipiscium sp.]